MAFNFNANDYDTSSMEYTCVPAGEYLCTIEKCDSEPGKKTEGSENIKVQYKIKQGDHQNQVIFQNIVFVNPSKQAEEIGRRMFARLAKCCNKSVLDEGPEELQGSDVYVKVAVGDYNGSPTNIVKNIFGVDKITGEKVDPDNKGTTSTATPGSVPPAGFGVQTKK